MNDFNPITPSVTAWSAFKAVVWREYYSRVGSGLSSLSWFLLEPISQIVLLGFFVSLVRANLTPGVDIVLFIVLGILNFTLFKSTADRVSGAIGANKALFCYSPVKPLFTVLARALIECTLQLIIWLFFICLAFLLERPFDLVNIFSVIICFILTASLGLSYGLLMLTSLAIHERLKHFLKLVLKPLYFLSCIFYSIQILPTEAQEFLKYNPLVHTVDLLRSGLLANYSSMNPSVIYVLTCGSIVLLVSLYLFDKKSALIIERAQ